MLLITFDVIESRKQTKQLSDFEQDNDFLSKIANKFSLNNEWIEISGGDQIRLLLTNEQDLFEVIMFTLKHINKFGLKVRIFISQGQIVGSGSLARLNGDVFYKNKTLETEVKLKKQLGFENSCHYLGNHKTEEIDLLLFAYSMLIIKHHEVNSVLYDYYYQKLTQKEIAELDNIAQSTVTKRLQKANAHVYERFVRELTRLIKED